MRAAQHPSEQARLQALREFGILDTPRETDFDEIVALAAEVCGTPISVVNLIDEDRQWFKAEVGLGVRETPLASSLCAHAILEKGIVEVPDTTLDKRFDDNPLVTGEPGLRFYAGALLQTPTGLPLGTLCVLDTVPRNLTEMQRNTLHVLGRQVMTQLQLRRKVQQLESAEHARINADLRAKADRDFVRLITDRLPVRVAYIDREYRYRFVNDAYERELGLTLEAVSGLTVAEVIGKEAFETGRTSLERAFRGESFTEELEMPYLQGERIVRTTCVPDTDRSGQVVGIVVQVQDVTETRKQERLRQTERENAEAAMRELNRSLEERVAVRTVELHGAVREAEAFNYAISHDLRTPLRAIASTSSIIIEEAGPELSQIHRDLLERQAHNATRLGTLIDELLRLSRLTRAEVRRKRIDLTMKSLEIVAQSELPCNVEVQPGMTADADPDLVRAVLQNLIGNAIKFSPEGGLIQVGEHEGTFFIRDHGVGFEMRFAEKIFLPFERLVAETEFSGTGIGLANVDRIVKRHGGRVWAQSEPGKGSTFYFTLTENP